MNYNGVMLDFVKSHNPSIFKFLEDNSVTPEYVKSASAITQGEVDGLNDVAFADRAHRLFPCHTKEACWKSAAFFAGSGESDAAIRKEIEKKASYHGISEDVSKVFSFFEDTLEKSACKKEASNKEYALTLDFEGRDGRGVENFYPINSASEVIGASDDAAMDYMSGRIPIEAMRKIASNISEAATRFNVPTSDLNAEVQKLGTRRLPDAFAAEYLIGSRKEASTKLYEASVAVIKDLQEKIASCKSHDAAISLADEAADKIVALDKEAGIISYTSTITDPYSAIFVGPTVEDMYKYAGTTVDISGIRVPCEDLINLSKDTIEQTFSKKAGSIILQAKENLGTEESIEKCARASELIGTLAEDTRTVLLNVLSSACW